MMTSGNAQCPEREHESMAGIALDRCDVLVVARDVEFVDVTCRRLRRAELRPKYTASINQAVRWLQTLRPRTVLVHRAMVEASASGFGAIAREVARQGIPVPVVVAADQAAVAQCITGLAGPVPPRANSVASGGDQADGHEDSIPKKIVANRLILHPAHYEARLDGELLTLSARQYNVLALLASERNRVVERRRLAEHMTSHDHEEDVSNRAVDNLISRLRKRLGPGVTIESVRGVGYRLVTEPGGVE